MSEVYAVPGVYVEEKNPLSLSIRSGETAVPVFVGIFNARSSSENEKVTCVRVENWPDFTRQFGPSDRITVDISTKHSNTHATSYVGSYSVRLYFENGGGPCYVLGLRREVLNDEDILSQIVPAIEQYPDITLLCWCEFIDSKTDKNIYTQLGQLLGASEASGGNRGMFLLTDAWLEGEMNTPSAWTFKTPDVAEKTQVASYFPALRTNYDRDYTSYVAASVVVTGFDSDQSALLVSLGVMKEKEVFVSFDKIKAEAAIITLAATKDIAALVDAKAIIDDIIKVVEEQLNSLAHAPKVEPVVLRASVAMAGVYARVDRDRGVWKAPANTALTGVSGLIATGLPSPKPKNGRNVQVPEKWFIPVDVDDALNEKMVSAGVNAVRTFRGQGTVVWGARTMSPSSLTDWLYVPVRRLCNTIERDARSALRTAVFEPNSPVTREVVRGALDNYLNTLWRQGALQGDSPTQAYFVETGLGVTMTPDDISTGKMVVKIGVAPVRPAEFIVLQLTQDVSTR